MGIFDDVFENAKTAANVVGKKAESLVDTSKLKIAEANLSSEISSKFKQLGSVVYSNAAVGTITDDTTAALIEELQQLHQELDAIRSLLAGIKNQTTCENCGKTISKSDLYCNVCGSRVNADGEA